MYNLFWNAGSVIDNFYLCSESVKCRVKRGVASNARAQNNFPKVVVDAWARQRLHRIADNIKCGLNKLLSVCRQRRYRRVIVAYKLYRAASYFGFNKAMDAFKHFMNVGWRKLRLLPQADKPVDQVTQPVSFFDDDVGIVA